MFKQVIITLLFLNTSFAIGQTLPSLNKQQMYDDFDTLTKMIVEVSPQGPVREKVTGLNLVAELAKLRIRIGQVKNTADFATLVRTAITLCQDGHTSLIWNGYNDTVQEYVEEGISKEAIQLLPLYDSLLRTSITKPFNLRLKYLKGEYYTIGAFTYRGKVFPAGLKLSKCNGVDIHNYVKHLVGSVRMMRWDFKRSRYFAENFFRSYHLTKKDSLILTFKAKNGQLSSSSFLLSDTLDYKIDQNTLLSFHNGADTFKTVEYIPKEQILYIRVPKMALEYVSYYPAMIREKGLNKPIKKIIIDIRDNPGGADNVWTSILKNLIAKPIVYKNRMVCNNSATMKVRFPEFVQNKEPYQASFLNNHEYLIYHMGDAILAPDSTTIGYEGQIYVIQNENIYSSAGSFTAVGLLAKNLTTVGNSTGRLLGRGVNPLLFELPHSKILYRIEPVIDFMNVNSAEDAFHDKVEVPFELSIDEYLDRLDAKESIYSTNYLLTKDPVFKKILTLK